MLEYAAPRRAIHRVGGQAGRPSRYRVGSEETRYLVERMGEHQHLVLRELEKLSLYAGPGPVRRADIDRVCSRTPETSVFELTDALAGGEGATVFNLLKSSTPPAKRAGLFYRVLWHFEKLVRVIALRNQGASLEAVQQQLKLKPHPARKPWKQSEFIDPDKAKRIVRVLTVADAHEGQAAPAVGGEDSRADGVRSLPWCHSWDSTRLTVGGRKRSGDRRGRGAPRGRAPAGDTWKITQEAPGAPLQLAGRGEDNVRPYPGAEGGSNRGDQRAFSVRATRDFFRAALFLCIALRAAALSMVEVSLVATALTSSSSPVAMLLLSRLKRVLMEDL